MRSDDEILAMPSFTLTQEEQQRKRTLEDERHQTAVVDQAYARGKQDTLIDRTIADKDLREDIRIAQWVNQENHGITYDRATESFGNVPDGWPEGIEDPDVFVSEWVSLRLDAATAPAEQQPQTSPGVTAFRKLIGE